MKDLGKLLRDKLEAADHSVDASTYTINAGSVKSYWGSGNSPFTPIGEQMEDVKAHIKQLDYILQRIVPNYDELVAQYRAVKDIEEAGK